MTSNNEYPTSWRLLRPETSVAFSLLAGLAILILEESLLSSGTIATFGISVVLMVAIVVVSVRVARHAEHLAHHIGDPYGTMILTLSAVLIEVVILAIMMSSPITTIQVAAIAS